MDGRFQSNTNRLKNFLQPLLFAGTAHLMVESLFKNSKYEFIYKELLGSAIMAFSAANRLTEYRTEAFAAAAASELLGIYHLSNSSLRATQYIFNNSMIANLSIPLLAVPGTIVFATRKAQEWAIKREYKRGAQRSDTTAMPSGLTSVGGFYFTFNDALLRELATPSYIFQLIAIGHNISNAERWYQ